MRLLALLLALAASPFRANAAPTETVASPDGRKEPEAFMLQGEGAHHGYEGIWTHGPISGLGSGDQGQPLTALLPLVFDRPGGPKLALIQADVHDYHALYMGYRPSHPRQMHSVFPRRVLAEPPGGFRDFDLVATERADDIAETAGTRSFPWRAFVVARRDVELLGNDMVSRRRVAREVAASAPLRLEMAPGGGAVVRLRRR